jgi:squalene-hopene/tetraprenyl-beta-curcumene cyclase
MSARLELAALPLALVVVAGGRPAVSAAQEPASSDAQAARPPHLEADELRALDEALRRGRAYLLAGQTDDGALGPRERPDVCGVATTALALWALSRTEDLATDSAPSDRAARYLLAHVQPDGGVYDPRRALHVYTSGVAARALQARCADAPSEELERAWRNAEVFAHRRGVPESVLDEDGEARLPTGQAPERAAELLHGDAELGEAEERALRFLEQLSGASAEVGPLRTRAHGWRLPPGVDAPFSYEDVLPIVYRSLRPEDDLARRALAAIRKHYTLERNPDLTRRYGDGGFREEHQGIYYYYLLLARTLAAFGDPSLHLESGEEHDWVRELARRLLVLQRPDGAWSNASDRWWEGEPVLVTSYAMLALDRCRRVRELREK